MANQTSPPHTFLSLLDLCDNFRPSTSPDPLTPWLVCSPSGRPSAIGLLRLEVVSHLRAHDAQRTAAGLAPHWVFSSAPDRPSVSFSSHLSTPSRRSAAIQALCADWRDAGLFGDTIGPRKWRGELYPVYADPFGAHLRAPDLRTGAEEEDEAARGCENYVFAMERAACALFGVVTYGVHMTVYERDERGIRVWVPQRARTKQTCVRDFFGCTLVSGAEKMVCLDGLGCWITRSRAGYPLGMALLNQ